MFPNNWLYSRIPRKIITSGEAISEVVKLVPGVKPRNVKSVSAGVDFRRFDFQIDGMPIRKELGVKSNKDQHKLLTIDEYPVGLINNNFNETGDYIYSDIKLF